jgi:membrane protease YdiL (CAAX protease family)
MRRFFTWGDAEGGAPAARQPEVRAEDGGGVGLERQDPRKKSDKRPAKNLGGRLRVIVNTLLIFLFSQLVAAFIAELGLSLIHPHSNLGLDSSVGAQFVYVLIAEGLAAYLAIRLVKKRGLPLSFIGLGRRPKRSDLLKAAIGFGIFYALLITAGIIVNALSPNLTNQKQDVGFNNIHSSLEHVLAFISLVIIPPLGEETLVRGYLYSGLRKVWRFWPALLVTSLVFGAAHLQLGGGTPLVWAAAIDTFLLSIVLVFLREKTGAIYAGILVHMLNNLIAFFVIIK